MKVINGNNIDVLKQYPNNYFDAVVTDPPYGLGKEPNATELMKDWIEHGYHEIKGTGFMGKEWDAFVPQPIFWKEVFRVLKHGGHILAFYGTRTFDWGVMAMRFAGFEVRDTVYWHYGSGFPKSHNISKAIDKMYGAERESIGIDDDYTDQAKQWDGWGSSLKPASEPIVLARKPLEKGLSIAENVLKWGPGGINIDGCRVSTDDVVSNQTEGQKLGRFPANLIMTHHPECECRGNCHEDCPIKIMDEQSGERKGWASQNHNSFNPYKGNSFNKSETGRNGFHQGYDDNGGASRFFYCAKASKSERNIGLDSNKNFHPTVKPVKLMQYLVRLITPPNGIVLDPFCGSGTTGIACKLEGFEFVGIEQDTEYTKIAQARIENFKENKDADIKADEIEENQLKMYF